MTTEAALRQALAELGGVALAILASERGSNVLSPEVARSLASAEAAARAALSLSPTEVRVEYRAAWDLHLRRSGGIIGPKEWIFQNITDAKLMLGKVSEDAAASKLIEARNLRIEARTTAGPWEPLEVKP